MSAVDQRIAPPPQHRRHRALLARRDALQEKLDAWYRKYAEREMRDVKFCLAFVHDPGSFHTKTKKIVEPADVIGVVVGEHGVVQARDAELVEAWHHAVAALAETKSDLDLDFLLPHQR